MLVLQRSVVMAVFVTMLGIAPARAQAASGNGLSRDSTASLFCAAWNATQPGERDRLLERSFSQNGTYTDPDSHVASRAALSDSIGLVLSRTPGARITCGHIQTHHDTMRMTWVMVDANGKELLRGMDFGEFADDGRLRRIVGFFDPAPTVPPG